MARTLAAVAQVVQGELIGPDAKFGAISTDTRTLTKGALFVALEGENFDGNDYLADAVRGGAAGALVSRPDQVELPQIAVGNTLTAFGQMARAWRGNFELPVAAVTGSTGKTTVKELIAAILGTRLGVCVTEGNLNNEIGVPITLMRVTAEHEAVVVELGANHAGEIAYLSSLVQPTVGVITNAGPAHLEGFGSVEGVAAAKGELLDHLPLSGTAILNADDGFWSEWRSRSRAQTVISFGLSGTADCTLLGEPQFDADGSRFTVHLPGGEALPVRLPLLGVHNVVNALAAAAAATAMGATADDIQAGLASVAPVHGRLLQFQGRGGARIVDDSYNANPASVAAALDYLAAQSGRCIFVLGDMGELGADTQDLHEEIGRYAKGKCELFVAIGSAAALAGDAFGASAIACDDIDAAFEVIADRLDASAIVLIKASRSMGLDRLVDRLRVDDARNGKGDAGC